VVVERSGYGDWSALAWRSDFARCLAQTVLTVAVALLCATLLQQLPAAGHPGAAFEQRTQQSTGRRVRRRVDPQ
jgi:hypothetical protein